MNGGWIINENDSEENVNDIEFRWRMNEMK